MERELGRLILGLPEERGAAGLALPAAEQRALGTVQAIQTVLDNPGYSDFECVEEITDILAQAGVPTSRHDFG